MAGDRSTAGTYLGRLLKVVERADTPERREIGDARREAQPE